MNVRLNPILLAAALAAQPVSAQGPLAPSGAPAPMMKTLTQVEPRTAITNVPYTITQPGSYYLATNVVSAGAGVTIATNWVTLDLMGFTLAGNRSGGGHGIWIYGASGTLPVLGVTVRNGGIRGFSYGIQAKFSQGARFENLSVSSNLNYGLNLDGLGGACDGNVVEDCSVLGNGDTGIRIYGYGDLVAASQSDGNVVRRCTVTGNATNGIVLDGSYHGRCAANVVADCTVANNSGYGIYLNGSASGKCQGNTLSRNVVCGNGSVGILVSGSPAGSCDGNVVVGCVVHANVDNGIHLVLARGNRIEGNHATDQTGLSYGFSAISAASNLFLRNSSIGHVYNYVPGAGDTYGPTVTNTGELATSGEAMHPWANFSR